MLKTTIYVCTYIVIQWHLNILRSINATEEYPDKHPWREQEKCDQQVKDVVHFLFRLLDDGGLLGWRLLYYNNIIGLLLLGWLCWRWVTAITLLRWWVALLRVALRRIALRSIGVICRRNYKRNKEAMWSSIWENTNITTPQPLCISLRPNHIPGIHHNTGAH